MSTKEVITFKPVSKDSLKERGLQPIFEDDQTLWETQFVFWAHSRVGAGYLSRAKFGLYFHLHNYPILLLDEIDEIWEVVITHEGIPPSERIS